MHERELNEVTNFRLRVGIGTIREMNKQGISNDVKHVLEKHRDNDSVLNILEKLNQQFKKQKFYFDIIKRPSGSYLLIKGMLD